MKKLLLLNVAGLLAASVAFGQMNYMPTVSQGLASGEVGTAYSQDITFTVPDSVQIDVSSLAPGLPVAVPPFTAAVTSTVLAVEGLPAGLSAACNLTGCDYGTGISGTISITGTPTQGGTFTVTVTSLTSGSGTADIPFLGPTTVNFPGTIQGQSVPEAPGVLDSEDYTMDIAGGGNAVQELNASSFDVIQNVPNPFSTTSSIKFSTPTPGEVTFKVFDVIGKQVYNSTITAEAGINVINLNAADFNAGAYFYTVSNGQKSFTKRMVVSGK